MDPRYFIQVWLYVAHQTKQDASKLDYVGIGYTIKSAKECVRYSNSCTDNYWESIIQTQHDGKNWS